MSRIKIGFYNKSVPYQIQKSRDIIQKMTGNTNFTNPDPKLEDIKTATNELEDAYTASLNNDKAKKALMRIKQKALLALIVQLADYVQTTSMGDEAIILSSGFEVRKTPAPLNVPETPVKVLVKAATHEQQLEISWKAIKGAKSYVVEFSLKADDFSDLKGGGIVTRARFTAINLLGGTKYWFRVMAVNAAGNSGWSEPASGRTL